MNKLKLLLKYAKKQLKKTMEISYEWWNWRTVRIGKIVLLFDKWRFVNYVKVNQFFGIGDENCPEMLLRYNPETNDIEKVM